MTGKIIKGIGGFYYIHAADNRIYACRAVGIFRKLGIKPLVGDDVEFEVTDEKDLEGSLTSIHERRNILIRPAVANIDQAMIIFAVREPDPNLNLLDRFLVYMGMQHIPVIIYFNKADLDKNGLVAKYRAIYEAAGYEVVCGSTDDQETLLKIRARLKGCTTVLAGPSGVGKSSLTNRLFEGAHMEVGELSQKIKRGRQTTRHTELIALKPREGDSAEDEAYVLDTPGFTSLFVTGVSSQELQDYFDEFAPRIPECRYVGCSHVNEGTPICGVRQAVEQGEISRERYENYCQIYRELKEQESTYR
ncbi:MAG: ribosome small subunit-dependent GTPase A [Lachnospiraceae bacterium]|nr:ribosome small subunit-dependent GTPase A [Lachnospiraceae bacterium]MBQ2040772.1 ribosome small subunit-dependent GTPase A [Lachnospiraceae bacterium]